MVVKQEPSPFYLRRKKRVFGTREAKEKLDIKGESEEGRTVEEERESKTPQRDHQEKHLLLPKRTESYQTKNLDLQHRPQPTSVRSHRGDEIDGVDVSSELGEVRRSREERLDRRRALVDRGEARSADDELGEVVVRGFESVLGVTISLGDDGSSLFERRRNRSVQGEEEMRGLREDSPAW